jgi:hypothetical protein
MANPILTPHDLENLSKVIQLGLTASSKSAFKDVKYFYLRSLSNVRHFAYVLALGHGDPDLIKQLDDCLHEASDFFNHLEDLAPANKYPAQYLKDEIYSVAVHKLIETGTCLAEQTQIDIEDHVIDAKKHMIESWNELTGEIKEIINEQVIVAKKEKE